SPASAAISRATAVVAAAVELRNRQLLQGGLQLWARRGEILQKLDFAIEVNDERGIFVLAQKLVEEAVAGAALVVQDAALAEAGVDQEAEAQRQIGFVREVVDGLRAAVFVQLK